MSSSALAIVSTIHVSLLVMRRHRSRPAGSDILILLPAVVFTFATWLTPEAALVAFGLVAHFVWFAYCEWRFSEPELLSVSTAAPRIVAPAAPTRAHARGGLSIAPSVVPHREPAPPMRAPATVPVLAVFDETPDIKTFRLLRPEGFDFIAGQFLTVRVQVDGNGVERCYSISSAPFARGYLEVSVKRIGLVSSVLHSSLRPGALMTVHAPAGGFTYPAGDDRPLMLIGGGIGITPLMSMLRHAVANDPSRPVVLLYSIRTQDCLAFRDDLALISRRHPQVRLAIVVEEGPTPDRWHRGRIAAPLVRAYATDLAHTLAYICGPPPMMKAMRTLLTELGVPEAQVRNEVFGAQPAGPAATPTPPHAAQAAPNSALVVRFARTGCEAQVSPQQTLLEAAESAGVTIPFSCRAGICKSCRTRLVEGDVTCDSASLTEEDRAAGLILPCVSHAHGNCTLEA